MPIESVVPVLSKQRYYLPVNNNQVKSNFTPSVLNNKQNTKNAAIAGGTALIGVSGIIFLASKKCDFKIISSLFKKIPAQRKAYLSSLAQGLSKDLGKKVKWKSLFSIMDKQEFMETVSKLRKENYVANEANMASGVFRADLHLQTNLSQNGLSVAEILDKAVEYGNKLFKKTGEKFIIAIADYDTVEGSKEALRIIAKDPKRFKNVRFVVGSELSYLINASKNGNLCESSNLLAYCFNPFSFRVNSFFKSIKARRLNNRKMFIEELAKTFPDVKYSLDEFEKVFLKGQGRNMPQSDDLWQLYHYGQIKHGLKMQSKLERKNPEEWLKEVMVQPPESCTLWGFKKHGILGFWNLDDPETAEILSKYHPILDSSGQIKQKTESLIDDIVRAFKGENSCIVGVSRPYYISEKCDNPAGVVEAAQKALGDTLKLTESYHQAYPYSLRVQHSDDIIKVNQVCTSKGLIPIGGGSFLK